MGNNIKDSEHQREFLRVPYGTVVSISKDDQEYRDYPIEDLSGGGVSFFAPESMFKEKDRIRGILYIEQKPVTFFAKIVRAAEHGHFAAEYVLIKESDRSKIIQAVLKEQLKYKK
ncbi:PilZ domain-containing protein [Paenibacillus campinasensis]|nr:PilZ domain-containing protein [Paenibacillus campinasensis]